MDLPYSIGEALGTDYFGLREPFTPQQESYLVRTREFVDAGGDRTRRRARPRREPAAGREFVQGLRRCPDRDPQRLRVDFHVIRHMADIESIHTFEGTETIQSLIVGRDITGIGAFS